jgi:hypothetical protein
VNSYEKIQEIQSRYAGPPGADADVAELALRTAAMGSAHLFAMLPDDPAVLDQYLGEAAGFLLSLRSDGVEPELHVAEGPAPAAELPPGEPERPEPQPAPDQPAQPVPDQPAAPLSPAPWGSRGSAGA